MKIHFLQHLWMEAQEIEERQAAEPKELKLLLCQHCNLYMYICIYNIYVYMYILLQNNHNRQDYLQRQANATKSP